MWPRNALSERLNIRWPILQAPMGWLSTPALAAAVSNAGGLGGLGMWGFAAEDAERRISGFRQQSPGSLNVNYPLWPEPSISKETTAAMRAHLQTHYDAHNLGPVPQPEGEAGEVSREHLAMLLRAKPQLVSFHFGLPQTDVIEAIKNAGIFIISSATTVREAKFLEDRGVDAIIAQGTEAGGHRGTFSGAAMGAQAGLMALLPQVVDAVKVPVIAAGGISDGRQVAAAFMLGASGVQLGTAFLRCEEANVLDAHRAALRRAEDSSTIVTDMITGRPARYITNRLTNDLIASGLEPVSFPAQYSMIAPLGQTGDGELTPLFAGQSVAMGRDTTAAELVEALADFDLAAASRIRSSMRPSETSRSKFMFDQYVLPPSRLSASGRRPSTGSLIIGIRPVTHLRFRKYNTKDIYPSQALNNDLAMAVRAGNRIWLRGQTGLDLDGNFVGVGDPAAQAENAMCCVKILLEEAGSELPHIVKTTIYLTDRAHREAVYQVVGRWLKGVYPCQTGLIVAGLAKPEMLMEIDVEAVIPSV